MNEIYLIFQYISDDCTYGYVDLIAITKTLEEARAYVSGSLNFSIERLDLITLERTRV